MWLPSFVHLHQHSHLHPHAHTNVCDTFAINILHSTQLLMYIHIQYIHMLSAHEYLEPIILYGSIKYLMRMCPFVLDKYTHLIPQFCACQMCVCVCLLLSLHCLCSHSAIYMYIFSSLFSSLPFSPVLSSSTRSLF